MDGIINEYLDMKKYLLEHKRLLLKYFAFNNLVFEKLKKFEVYTIDDKYYSEIQNQINIIQETIIETCSSLENINLATEHDYSLDMVMDKSRIEVFSQEALRQCKNYYMLARDCIDDEFIADKQLLDMEQLHFLIGKFFSLIVKNYNICIDKIDENLRDYTSFSEK